MVNMIVFHRILCILISNANKYEMHGQSPYVVVILFNWYLRTHFFWHLYFYYNEWPNTKVQLDIHRLLWVYSILYFFSIRITYTNPLIRLQNLSILITRTLYLNLTTSNQLHYISFTILTFLLKKLTVL